MRACATRHTHTHARMHRTHIAHTYKTHAHCMLEACRTCVSRLASMDAGRVICLRWCAGSCTHQRAWVGQCRCWCVCSMSSRYGAVQLLIIMVTCHIRASHHITPHHTTSHPIASHPIASHHITSHHIASHPIPSHRITR